MICIWTTPLHYDFFEKLEGENKKIIFLKTKGFFLFRLTSLFSVYARLLFTKEKVYIPRVACFEFLMLRFLLRDKVILTTDGLSDLLPILMPRLNLSFFKPLLNRPVDLNIFNTPFLKNKDIAFNDSSNKIVFFEKIQSSKIQSFLSRNNSYEFVKKIKGKRLRCSARALLTFSSTVVFEYLHEFPVERIIVIKASDLEVDELTRARHLVYEKELEKIGVTLVSLHDQICLKV